MAVKEIPKVWKNGELNEENVMFLMTLTIEDVQFVLINLEDII